MISDKDIAPTPSDAFLFVLPWSLDFAGGVNEVIKNLYRQMKIGHKYEPILLVNSWDDIGLRKQNIGGIDHHFLRLRSPWSFEKKIRNFLAFCFGLYRGLRNFYDFVKLNNVVCINVHYCSLFALNISIMKLLGLFNGKFVLSFHGQDLLVAKKSKGIEKILWKIVMHSADTIITCSESLRAEVVSFEQSTSNKTLSVHNGIDTSILSAREHFDLCKKFGWRNYILNVATLEKKKGQDVLLRAFSQIFKEFDDLGLIIIGRPGGAEEDIRELIVSLGLSHRVKLYGGLTHSEVLSFMEQALIFVLPSRYEPFGIVILEAGLFGSPVIASNVGGIREILTHNYTGILVEPNDVHALSKEMYDLIINPQERLRLGRSLNKHVLENFSWEKTYHNYLDAIGL